MVRFSTIAVVLLAAMMAPVCASADNWGIPPQMELRVPFGPTAYPSGGRIHLMYELYMTNFSSDPIDLRGIEVFDAGVPVDKPLASFEGEQIDSLIQKVGGRPSNDAARRQVDAGATVVVFMHVDFDSRARVPDKLRHRVLTAGDFIEGAVTTSQGTELKALVSPVRGTNWQASDGPSNDPQNHHRRGGLVLEGRRSISSRYATDWFLTDGKIYKWRKGDDAHDKASYYSYGQAVYAVADGTVVAARDGMPDNYPGPVEDFRRAVALTFETAFGNMVVLDLGGGQYAHYGHLQPGSVRVKIGERVRSGDVLARIGVSGDPNVPHLHFEVTTSAKPLAGEGIPYVIDQYRVKAPDGAWDAVTRELPSRNMLVAFGPTKDEKPTTAQDSRANR
jgi:murein DD-endopeptidase MepM/ murein hydrolase activator NlpD